MTTPTTDTVPAADTKPCGWKCGDFTPGHNHHAVLVREHGNLVGRLTPQGGATNRKVHAAIFSRSKATRVAAEINAAGTFTAKVIPF